MVILPVAQLVLALLVPAQLAPPACRFEEVVAAPNQAPAFVRRETSKQPDFSGLLLPAREREIVVWITISDRGEVTDVCVPDAPDAFLERAAAAARTLRYEPARHNGRAAASVGAVRYTVPPHQAPHGMFAELALTTDVASLERIAASADAAAEFWASDRQRVGQPKDLRIAAYARLGELGTAASIAAQKRIEDALRARTMLRDSVSLVERWTHPGWHMTDYSPPPLAQAYTRGRARFVIVTADILGPWQLYLLRCDPDGGPQCARPKPVGIPAIRYFRLDATLTEVAPGRLRLTIEPRAPVQPPIMDGTAPAPGAASAIPAAATHDLVIADIERDSDGDGWTDLEERALGLDPSSRDSDSDGIDDALDRSPLYRATPADDDDAAILQRAVFAVFGVTESAWVLFARDEKVRPIQAWGLAAPVLFNRPLKADPLAGGPGGVFVSWRIVQKNAAEATVEITDWEGPMAAGGQEVFLRSIHGTWVVVARQRTWIS